LDWIGDGIGLDSNFQACVSNGFISPKLCLFSSLIIPNCLLPKVVFVFFTNNT
jgi:hypothetical protein